VSGPADQLAEDDYRELAAIIRRTHARTAARHQREREAAGLAAPCQCPACEYTRRASPAGGRDDAAT